MSNRLAAETSPYLLQHAENPVDWYPWGDEAFEAARREDRPVLLSVGYSACHWCHVMAHESFEDPEIAALMNELFINVKVDREERPDVDRIYMQAVQALTESGGWPMTVFLTPDGAPFFGGTYFPPADRHGMRGLPFVLRATAEAYRERRQDVETSAARLREVLRAPRLRGDGEPQPQQLDGAVRTLIAQADMRDGGFGGGPKFPHAAAIDLLLRRHRATGDRLAWDTAEVALDRMARGGINDQVGGGFHRYSVDGRWAVPHFEKMLYDQALLAPVYLHAHQLTGDLRWRRVAEETLDYVLREMRLEAGGFASSQDADTDAGEGAFFVWTPAEIHDALGEEDGELACQVFGVTEAGNVEGGRSVLSLPHSADELAAARGTGMDIGERVQDMRRRLHDVRARRAAPGRDDKVITSWNALMVRALAEAGAALDRESLVVAAREAAEFLLRELRPGGVVLRTWRGGEAKITGFLEDVAYLADALITLYEATGEPRWFHEAARACEDMMNRFHAPGEGFYDTAVDDGKLPVRPFTLDDNPIPAGQSVAAHAFLRLAGLTGQEVWRDRAMEIIRPLASAVARAPLAIPNVAAALDLALTAPRELAIAGPRDDPGTRELFRTAAALYDPGRVMAWGEADGIPLLQGREPVGGRAAAYVCERFTCRRPVTDAAELRSQLESRSISSP